MKIYRNLTLAMSLFVAGATLPAHALDRVLPNFPSASKTSPFTEVRSPIVSETYALNLFIRKGERKTYWKTFTKPADYDQMAAFVAIIYGDLLSINCDLALYDGNNPRPFKTIRCGRSQQWNPTTPDVPELPSTLRVKLSLYNADFTKSSKRVSIRLTPNFGSQDDNDLDGLPGWYEVLRGLSDSNINDAHMDPDGDGFTTLEEYLTGRDPFNPNA
ncbi:hypothetical protein ACH42_17370 [Endozoicomonas sp. (ex Bugula neritina AB1)]|nr:hypothetical protein ACH42_17370 [Endozoicomonas sp. (ex Bugula neritina AB1)]